MERKYKNRTSEKRSEVLVLNKKYKKIKFKSDALPDLSDKIKVLEDIFENKEKRVSEIMYFLDQNMPESIWLTNLSYNGEEFIIEGYSFKEYTESSEHVLYGFEKKLIGSEYFSTVILDNITEEELNGNSVKKFRYELKFN